ncbi:UDP-N-acetylglucosamine--peptide N-acetylglucosaminyltransferase GtfA subunit [Bacteroides pyogenes]|uniref:ABC transporter n=2 Tax=Bacteroides pyogenes TaxID=310300 RepID=W4PCP8_9BACE|nr:glycosyltransferase [Bacteroides pyogenes]GAE14804.1 cell division protein DivIC [Bacteroides pyogenes JCM 6292]MBR8706497.1 UDP-N-acetylglucosamine--peptide N-acetylglucosaminyltransferase GtfA subunit [Bacteroides pyogenes]MBR8720460.1 UDP-N-acetylglucosamine--peptide N-acetylglucosaminyltransferase GtfA subunit [Bacteroides pyogenes]MBR8725252.1 UDP-N-acetylglucosamine--peptide N-acetylglucosaminyltransferase GtfA subunit [Bacteroides pyogenes]MBR8738721.1 UDP-N-acetylglucosamine--peptid
MPSLQRKKRILFYHIDFPCGGAERVTRDIAQWVRNFDYEVYIAACHKKGEAENVSLIELPHEDYHSKENADAIVDLIRTLSIDIFVLPGIQCRQFAYIRSACTSCKFVYILHNVPFWEVIGNSEHKKHAAKGSFWKTLEWHLLTNPKATWLKVYEKRLMKEYKKTYDLVDAYVVLCEGYKSELEKKLRLSDLNKITVIHNAEYEVENISMDKKKQLLFVGRMTYEHKRVDRLLDIWKMIYKKVPGWELILVGSGSEERALRQRAEKMKLERVTFTGWSLNPSVFYKHASVSCLTSTFEGWPLCLTEAQANGVVPIAFDCCAGIREILSPSGENGILIPPFRKRIYADELCKLLLDPEKLACMRENVIRKSQEYSVEEVGRKWLQLFDRLTGE